MIQIGKTLFLIEADPLPPCCVNCRDANIGKEMGLTEDAYCYNCDYALLRWKIEKNHLT